MKKNHLYYQDHEFDVCVVGGGMAGICAAIASARNGAKTAIVQDRPVFGGNASSEIRMWICGAHGANVKETGILEEIQLENQYRNPGGNYSIWDSVLWAKIAYQPNLTAFLNCSCTDAEMDGNRIVGIKAWQLTNQTWHTIRAKTFIDCSGDSILAAVTGAEFRQGRESREEFDEDIQPTKGDRKTMGNTLLIQVRRTDSAQSFVSPRWAYKFEGPQDLPHRLDGVSAHNFWWLEVGGLQDTIRDSEVIRDELMRIGYGVWDYIKNRAPKRDQAADWALEWIGSLPGKRENRRFVGDHTLTQNDVRASGYFNDIIAYGGWSMDDHHPAGLFFPGAPTVFHAAPSPYGIPYRSLYSRNISNLLFAGRNISVTHAALSSTRVMATCAILGQAAGTAAALCQKYNCDPRSLSSGDRLAQLQSILQDDDCWLPGKTRDLSALALKGKISGKGKINALLDGHDRDEEAHTHAWHGTPGSAVEYHWNAPTQIAGLRFVFDSNLQLHKRMPCTYPHRESASAVPKSLVKAYRIEAQEPNGDWKVVFREDNNYQRLVQASLNLRTQAIRFVPEETWGDPDVRIFSFEPLEKLTAKTPVHVDGPTFTEVRSKMNPADLTPPEGKIEHENEKARRRPSA
jgi:hypothetical protein